MVKSKRQLQKYLETNDNENTTVQNLGNAAKETLLKKNI